MKQKKMLNYSYYSHSPNKQISDSQNNSSFIQKSTILEQNMINFVEKDHILQAKVEN